MGWEHGVFDTAYFSGKRVVIWGVELYQMKRIGRDDVWYSFKVRVCLIGRCDIKSPLIGIPFNHLSFQAQAFLEVLMEVIVYLVGDVLN